MDKSFNDQELSDIMKEIEALEEDFTSEEKTASEIDDPAPVAKKTTEVVAMDSYRAPKTSAPTQETTSMSFKVQGNMALDLEFNIGGKVIALSVTESGLSIEMDGGAKFTVPVGKKAA